MLMEFITSNIESPSSSSSSDHSSSFAMAFNACLRRAFGTVESRYLWPRPILWWLYNHKRQTYRVEYHQLVYQDLKEPQYPSFSSLRIFSDYKCIIIMFYQDQFLEYTPFSLKAWIQFPKSHLIAVSFSVSSLYLRVFFPLSNTIFWLWTLQLN